MKKLVVIYCFLIALTGCKTKTVYVPVQSVRTEYRDLHTRDSIYLRDSIYVLQKGDTVLIEKFRTLYKDQLVRDSIFIQDTIRVPYPVDKIITVNKTTWYQDILIWIGVGAVALLLIWLIKRRI